MVHEVPRSWHHHHFMEAFRNRKYLARTMTDNLIGNVKCGFLLKFKLKDDPNAYLATSTCSKTNDESCMASTTRTSREMPPWTQRLMSNLNQLEVLSI